MGHDWDIRARSAACTDCGSAFEDKQPYASALFRGEDGYTRGDFCSGCWTARGGNAPAPYSTWQGIYRPPPVTAEPDPLRKETAESLLRRLIEDEDPENISVINILAIMLERKKVLVEKDVTLDDDGTVHRIYEHRRTGETLIILDPRLQVDRLEDVQLRVIRMLSGPSRSDLPQPPDAHVQPENC